MLKLIAEAEETLEMLMVLHDCHLGGAGPIVRAIVQKRIEATQAALESARRAMRPDEGAQRIVLPLPPLGNRYLRRAGHTIYKRADGQKSLF